MSSGPVTIKGGDPGKDAKERREQPIDLAQKAVPPLGPQQVSPAQAQSLIMHTHLDPTKTAFTPLRLPVPTRGLSTVTGSVVGPQILASKQVSRIQAEGVAGTQQGHGSTLGGATLVTSQPAGVVPPRQVMTTTVYPVMSLGSTAGNTATAVPMASIIRGTTAGTPAAALYSSHMPRGPAAVASLSAGPKSAVATPILRHAPAALQQFTPRVLGMTAARGGPPLGKTTSTALTQVLDSTKLGRPIVDSSRTASLVVAPPTVAIGKVPPGITATTASQLPGSTEKFFKPLLSQHHMVSANPQVTRGNASTCVVTIAPGPQTQQLRVTGTHPTLTVVTGKPSQSTSALAIANKVGNETIKKVAAGVGLSSVSSRPLQQQQPLATGGTSTTATAIPVARVYPQQPGVGSSLESQESTGSRGNIYITHAPGSGSATVNQGQTVAGSVSTIPTVMLSEARTESAPLRLTSLSRGGPGATTYAMSPSTAYFYDPFQGSTVQPFTTSSTASTQGTGGTMSSTTNSSNTSTNIITTTQSPFAATGIPTASLRPSLPVSSATTVTASSGGAGTVRPLGSLLVTVEGSRQQVALHPVISTPANSSPVTGILSGTEVFPAASLSPSGGLGVIHGNHNTSPRPSILRKRTTDMATVQGAKKNLMSSAIFPAGSNSSGSGSPAGSPMVIDPPVVGTPPGSGPSLGKPILPAPAPSPVSQPSSSVSSSSSTSSAFSATSASPVLSLSAVSSSTCTATNTLATIASSLATVPARNHQNRDQASENGFLIKKEEIGVATIKVEQQDNSPDSVSKCQFPVPNGLSAMEASPRKKPRKQQLAAHDLLESHSTDGEDNFGREVRGSVKREPNNDDGSCKWVTFSKRPCMSLLNSYQQSWKSKHNHFLRHSDVKPKDEKKPSVNELANQKGVLQKINGWKIYYLATQMDEVREAEQTVRERLGDLLSHLEQKNYRWKKPLGSDEERIMGKLTDLIKGNLQRSNIVQEQIGEVKQQVVKVVDHKSHIVNIISKYISKRHIKKKNS